MHMGIITYKDYIVGIKAKYEVEKEKNYACYLSKPSPALLHDYCEILKQNGLSKKDEDVLEKFYKSPNFDNDKFRPICNFFKGRTENPSHDILDMMALLVDFQPRPLGSFLERKGNVLLEMEAEKDELNKQKKVEIGESTAIKTFAIQIENRFKGIILTIGVLLSFVLLSLFVYYSFFNHKPCLEWNSDRYVEVDCSAQINGFADLDSKKPYNENLLMLRKIIPTDTTTYFRNGKAVVWYCKNSQGDLELFNAPGHHPETNKPLKAITEYMIEKYIVPSFFKKSS
jgi:hypothetical protein